MGTRQGLAERREFVGGCSWGDGWAESEGGGRQTLKGGRGGGGGQAQNKKGGKAARRIGMEGMEGAGGWGKGKESPSGKGGECRRERRGGKHVSH